MDEWRVNILDKLLNERMPLDKGLTLCQYLVNVDIAIALSKGLITKKPKEVVKRNLITPHKIERPKLNFYPESFKTNINWNIENSFGLYGYSDGKYYQYRREVEDKYKILEINKEQYDSQFVAKDIFGTIICNGYN